MQSTVTMAGVDVSLAVADEPKEYDDDDAKDEDDEEPVQASDNGGDEVGSVLPLVRVISAFKL